MDTQQVEQKIAELNVKNELTAQDVEDLKNLFDYKNQQAEIECRRAMYTAINLIFNSEAIQKLDGKLVDENTLRYCVMSDAVENFETLGVYQTIYQEDMSSETVRAVRLLLKDGHTSMILVSSIEN